MDNTECVTSDGEALQDGDIVCFERPLNEYEASALLVVRECRGARILVSDQIDMLAKHADGYIVPTQAIFARDVLKVA